MIVMTAMAMDIFIIPVELVEGMDKNIIFLLKPGLRNAIIAMEQDIFVAINVGLKDILSVNIAKVTVLSNALFVMDMV